MFESRTMDVQQAKRLVSNIFALQAQTRLDRGPTARSSDADLPLLRGVGDQWQGRAHVIATDYAGPTASSSSRVCQSV